MPVPNRLLVTLLLGTLLAAASCSSPDRAQPNTTGQHNAATAEPPAPATAAPPTTAADTSVIIRYDTNPKELLAGFDPWYKYHYFTIKLAQNFISLDTDSSIISKEQFLDRLATGNFIALKVLKKDNVPYYKLVKSTSPDLTIKTTIQQMAADEIRHSKMEGQPLPAYHFTDLQGKEYSNATTKGKILVLKCWYISCTACVQEFPQLNDLVDQYKNRKDVLFVSLAFDSKEELTDFLSKKEFKYAVVPNEKNYMMQQLHVLAYPTHILVGQDGKIRKVTNNVADLVPFIPSLTSPSKV